jgi:hypothetical protein
VSNSLLAAGTRYQVFRKDRILSRRGGGVCILTNSVTLSAVEVPIPDQFSIVEMVVTDVLPNACQSAKFRLF